MRWGTAGVIAVENGHLYTVDNRRFGGIYIGGVTMLDYKDIITKHYVLHLTGAEIARQLDVRKSGVNDFLRAFKQHESLLFPLPEGITNYGIAELVYGHGPGNNSRDITFELPDFEEIHRQMQTRKNMTLVEQWNRYMRRCEAEEKKFYQGE